MIALSGNPADEIVKYAEESGFDLIVIGRKENRGFARLFGTTSTRIAKRAKTEVVIVR